MEEAVSPRRTGVLTVVTAVALSAALSGCAPVPAPVITPEQAISADTPRIEWGLVMHGGAGGRTPPAWTPAQRATREASMAAALQAGYAVLAAGGSALDAVEAAVIVLEDDSTFNAGRGAVFNAAGENELDASIMDGPTLSVGAVAGVKRVKNPIRLARAVMERSGHVMMVAGGAEEFARQVGIELVDPRYFFTQAAWTSLERERAAEQRRRDSIAAAQPRGAQTGNGGSYYGTVGAVALDRQGRLAAATSTGGRTNKRPGRVGDVAVIGAGNYANPRCAISTTGHGEWFIRYTVARDVCVGVEHRGQSLVAAADSILFRVLDPLRVDGGLVGMDSAGNVMMAFNTAVMPRGYVGPDGEPKILLTR